MGNSYNIGGLRVYSTVTGNCAFIVRCAGYFLLFCASYYRIRQHRKSLEKIRKENSNRARVPSHCSPDQCLPQCLFPSTSAEGENNFSIDCWRIYPIKNLILVIIYHHFTKIILKLFWNYFIFFKRLRLTFNRSTNNHVYQYVLHISHTQSNQPIMKCCLKNWIHIFNMKLLNELRYILQYTLRLYPFLHEIWNIHHIIYTVIIPHWII